MLKKTITYTDYNGDTVTEDFYFNLSKVELMDMQLSEEGGFDNLIKKIADSKDPAKMIALFKLVLLKSYGKKTEDGKRFVKNDALTEAFMQTEAYSELFMEIATNEEAATNFIKGIMPADLLNDMDKKIEEFKKKE